MVLDTKSSEPPQRHPTANVPRSVPPLGPAPGHGERGRSRTEGAGPSQGHGARRSNQSSRNQQARQGHGYNNQSGRVRGQ